MDGRQLLKHYERVNVPSTHAERFSYRLRHYHLAMENVDQDNHVQFRVLGRLCFGSQRHHDIARICVATQIEQNRRRYAPSIVARGYRFEDYCWLLRNGFPGDNISLLAGCELFQVTLRKLLDNKLYTFEEIAPKKETNWRGIASRKVLSFCETRDFTNPLLPLEGYVDAHFEAEATLIRENLDNHRVIIETCANLFRDSPLVHMPMDEFSRQNLRLFERGYVRIRMEGDGNCVHRSMSYCVYRDQHMHYDVRQMTTDQMFLNPRRYRPLCCLRRDERRPNQFYRYLKRMSKDGQWGDNAVVQATCDLFGIKITILDADPTDYLHEMFPHYSYSKECFVTQTRDHMDVMVPWQEFEVQL